MKGGFKRMKKLLLLICIMAMLSFVSSQVVINEFSYDDSSTDDEEFIELYNSSGSPVDISGWYVDLINGSDGASYGTWTVPASTTLAADDYYVMGESTCPNVDLSITSPDLQNGPDALVLKNSSATIIDAVGYNTMVSHSLAGTDYEGTGIMGDWAYSGFTPDEDCSISRVKDGYDNDDNDRDFCLVQSSPGEDNEVNIPSYPYTNNFDDTTSTTYSEWWGVWVDGTCFDPTVDLETPGVSPQGGNAMVVSDSSGGGNRTYFTSAAMDDWVFEAYVYINSTLGTNSGGTGYVAWEIGKGCTDYGFYYYEDGSGSNRYGSRGVFWRYDNSEVAGNVVLTLVERYAGTSTPIGSSITISSGVNDGWQRLYLATSGTSVLGILGGTYGSTGDGEQRSGTIENIPGGFYTGYREYIDSNDNWLWIDGVSLFGSSTPVLDWALY